MKIHRVACCWLHVLALAFQVFIFQAVPSHAADLTWTYSGNGSWTDNASWTPSQQPGGGDGVLFNGSASDYTSTLGANYAIFLLTVNGTSGSGNLTIAPGGSYTLTLSSDGNQSSAIQIDADAGAVSIQSALNLDRNDGSDNIISVENQGGLTVTQFATGTDGFLKQGNGTLYLNLLGEDRIGYYSAIERGAVELTSGNLLQMASMGIAGTAGSNGTLNIQSGNFSVTSGTFDAGAEGAGTVNVNGGNLTLASQVNIGTGNGTAVVNVNSGEFRQTGSGSVMTIGGGAGSGAVNIAGGEFSVAGGFSIGENGTLTVSGGNTTIGNATDSNYGITANGSNTVVTLTGGTIAAGNVVLANDAVFNLGNGTTAGSAQILSIYTSQGDYGTLNLNHNSAITLGSDITKGIDINQIGSGTTTLTGNISTNATTTITSGTLAFGGNSTSPFISIPSITNDSALAFTRSSKTAYAGVISGTGSVTQNGSGMTILSGNNTYTGPTLVQNGTLSLSSQQALYNGTAADYVPANINVESGATLAFGIGSNSSFTSNSVASLLSGLLNNATASGGFQAGSFVGFNTADANGSALTPGNTILEFGIGDSSQGAVGVSKIGNGTLTLNATNTYTGDTRVTGGRLNIGADASLASGNLVVTGDGSIDFRNSGVTFANISLAEDGTITSSASLNFTDSAIVSSGTLISPVGGTGYFLKTGNGTAIIAGNFLHTGGTTIEDGVLQNAAGSISGNVAILQNGTLEFDRVEDGLPVSSSFSGNGAISKLRNSTLTLDGDSSGFAGTTTISAGTLQIGNGGATGALGGAIIANAGGTLAYNTPGTVVLGELSGNGSLVQAGTGTLIVSADQTTFTGTTQIESGTLQLGNGGTTGSISGNITNHGTLALNRSDDFTFLNNAPGTGTLLKLGSNTVTLNTTQSNTGGTIIDAGTLLLVGDNRLATSGNLSINAAGTLDLGSNNQTLSTVSLNGGNITGSGRLSANSSFAIQSGSASALLAGTAQLVKTSNATFVLTGNNTYSGKTIVEDGMLSFDLSNASATAAQALGTNADFDLGAELSTSGTLNYTGAAATFAKNIKALGAGNNTVQNSGSGLLTLTGNITKNGTTLVLAAGTGGIQVDGAIDGSAENSDLILNGGNFTLNATNTYNGPTYLNNGVTLTLAATNALPGDLIIDATSSVALGANQTMGALTGAAGASIDLGSHTLAMGSNGTDTLYEGTIVGTGNLVKAGSNAITLSGTNTYNGTSTINGGVLVFGTPASLYNGDNSTWTGDNIIVNSGGAFALSVGANGSFSAEQVDSIFQTLTSNATAGGILDGGSLGLDVTGEISLGEVATDREGGGAVGFVKLGNGVLTITGTNTYTGSTAIRGGTIALASSDLLVPTGSLTLQGGSTLALGSNTQTFDQVTLTAGSIAGNGTLTASGYAVQSGSATANLVGNATFQKTGTGTFLLSGNNAYTGSTTISGGTLTFLNANSLYGSNSARWNSGNISAASGSTVVFGLGADGGFSAADITTLFNNLTQNQTSAGGIAAGAKIGLDTNGDNASISTAFKNRTGTGSGTLTLLKLGAGTLTLTGNNTYTGGTFIESGTLAGNSLGINGTITNNATLLLNQTETISETYSPEISGTGALITNGSIKFLGNATMTGGTTIQSGTLQIGGTRDFIANYKTGSIIGNIINEGTLVFDNSTPTGDRTINGVISGNGSLRTTYYSSYYNSSATLYLNGNNTFTGGTMVNSGKINISGGSLAATGNVTVGFLGTFDIGASNQTIGNFTINSNFPLSAKAQGSGTLTAASYNLQGGTVSLGLGGTADITKNTISSYSEYPSSYLNGRVYLSGNNISTGNVTINSGILSFDNVQSLYSGNNASWTIEKISVSANASLALGTGNGNATVGFNNTQIAEIFSNLTQNGTGGLRPNSKIGFTTYSDFTLTTDITDRPDGGAIGMDKIGWANLTLDSNNTFTGNLSIFEGSVVLGRNNALRTDSDLVIDAQGSADYGFNVGNFTQQFRDVTLKKGLIAGDSGAVIATGNYTMIKGNATASLSGNASLIKTNTSGNSYNVGEPESVYLSGNNSYTGNTTVQGVQWSGTQYPSPSSNSGAPTKENAKLQFQTVGSLYSGNETLWTPENIIVEDYGILSLRTGTAGFNATQVTTIIQNLITANRSGAAGGFLDKSMLGIDTNGEDFVINDDIGDTTGLATGGGAVGLIKYGNGTLTLNGNSTRSFSTSVTGGNLVLGSNATLSSASANLLVDGAVLDISTTNQTVRKVTVTNGTIIGSGTLTSSGDGFLFGSGANITANLAGAVGAVIDSNSGNTTLSGNNTFTGNTTIGSAATLNLANVNALSGSTLVLNDYEYSPAWTLQFSVAGTNTYNLGGLSGSGNLTLGANSLSIGANSQNTTYSARLSGTGSITKVGNGTLTLSGSNTYTGGTTISSGTLVVSSTGQISHSGSNFYAGFGSGDDATFTLNGGNVSGAAGFIGYGNGSVGTANINSGNWTSSLSMRVGYWGDGTLNLTGGNISNVNGMIGKYGNSTGVANVSGGTWSTSGYMYVGDEDSSTGTLNLTGGNVVVGGGSGNLTLAGEANATGTLNLGNGSSIGSLQAARVIGGNGTATVNIDHTGNFSFAPILTGNLTVNKLGSGTTTLSGNNTYTGGTFITSGTLQGNSQSLQGAITNNAVVNFDQATNGTYAGLMSGNGSLLKSGIGTLTLSGTNTYNGGTTVSAGTLAGTTSSLQGAITNNAAVNFNQSTDGTYAGVMSGSGTLVKSGNGTVTLSSNNTYTGGTTVSAGTLAGTTSSLQGAITNNAAVNFDQATDGTYAGAMNGSGQLVKSGNGTVTLSGSNTYSGGTTVSAGTLAGTTSSLQGTITNNAVVNFDQATDGTYAGAMNGSGQLVKSGNGSVTLSGNNVYTGGTNLNAGALTITGSVNGTTSLEVNGASSLAIAGSLSTNGSINANSGTITIGQGGSLAVGGTTTTIVSTPSLFVGNSGDDTISVIDVSNNSLIHSISGLNAPIGLVIDATGSIYVANRAGGSISVFSSNGSNTGTITTGPAPYGLALSPSGSQIYAANFSGNAIWVIDTATNIVTATIPVGSMPLNVTSSPSGTTVYSVNYLGNSISVIDTATNTVTATIAVGSEPMGLASNPTGTRIYVANTGGNSISVIDTTTNTVTDTITGLSGPRGLAFNLSGTEIYATMFDGGEIGLIDTTTNTVTSTIPVGAQPIEVVSNASGTLVYTSNNLGNSISVIDTTTNTVTDTITGLNGPWGLALGNFTSEVTESNGITLAASASENATLNIGTFGGSDTSATLTTSHIAFGNGTAAMNLNLAGDLSLSADLTGGNSNSTLNQLGNGTTTLTSANSTYAGAININSGTLAVTGSLASAASQINSGGTLAGNGTLGAVTINSGGTIAPGSSPGILTVGNSVWNGGGIYNWELASANGTAGTDWDLITSSGNLTINANSGNQFIINASTSNASGFDPNVKNASWKIAEFAGGITGFSAEAFAINPTGFENLPAMYAFGITTNGTAMNFSYATVATWIGGTGNWTNTADWDTEFAPINGVAVDYAGTNGTSTNDSSVGNIGGLAFTNNSTGSFTLAGGALTIGAGGITNNSAYTNTVGINIVLGANQTFAANTANLVVSGNISGNGSLTKSGNESLTLSGTNTYSGGTIVNAGKLQVSGGVGSVSNNATLMVQAGGAVGAVANNLGATATNAGTVASLVNNGSFTNSGNITGNVTSDGTLTSNGTIGGTLGLNGGTATIGTEGQVEGTSTVTSGTLEVSGTVAGVSNSATLTVQAGGTAGAVANNLGATVTNNGTVASLVNAGTFTNSGNITGNATTSGTLSSTGTIGGTLGVNGGTATIGVGGQVEGTSTVAAGTFDVSGRVAGVTNSAIFTVQQSGTAGSVNNLIGATVTNNGTVASLVNAGTFTNSGNIAGSVTTNGTLASTGAIGGTLGVNGGTATIGVDGQVDGTSTVTAGTFDVSGTVAGVTNSAIFTVQQSGTAGSVNNLIGATGTSNGTVASLANAGTFTNSGNITGSVTSNGTLTSTGTIGGTLGVNGGTATIGVDGQVEGASTVAAGTFDVSGAVAGVTNNAIFNVQQTGTAGSVANLIGATGTNNGTVASLVNAGTFTNSGNITGNTTTSGTLASNGTIGGTLGVNGGAATIEADGQVVGGTTVSAGTLEVSGAVGSVSNNAIFTVQSGGTAGAVSNLLGATGTSTGTVASLVNNGSFTNSGNITGDTTTSGTLASTGTISGALAVNGGVTTISGTVLGTTTLSGGVLQGTGTLGAVTINSGGAIAPGNSPGTITVGNSVWNGGGIYNWQLGYATGTAGVDWDLINSAGSLTINATSGEKFVINATALDGSGFDSTAESYKWQIANFSGNITGFSTDKFVINPSGFDGAAGVGAFSVTANATAINLNYRSLFVWDAGNGTWSTDTNWVDNTLPVNGAPIEFDGIGGTSTNDSYLTSISGLTFTANATESYTLAGGFLSIGAGGITNDSAFSNTIGMNLVLGANQTFAANTANLVVSGNISGNVSLTKEGNETLTLSGTNTYSGGTIVNAGTLEVSGTVAGVSNNATLTVQAGGTVEEVANNLGSTGTNNGTVASLVNAGTFTNSGNITGNVTSDGTLTSNGTIGGTLGVNGGTATIGVGGQVEGTSTVTSGTLEVSGTVAGVSNSATLTVQAGGTAGAVANNLGATVTNNGTVASLVNAGTFTNSGNITGNATTSGTLSSTGTIGGTLGVNGGTATIGVGGQVEGTSTVAAGTFDVSGRVAGVTNSATLTVQSGGTAGALTNNVGATAANSGTVASLANAGTFTNSGNITGSVTTNGTLASTGAIGGTLGVDGGSATIGALGQVAGSTTVTAGTLEVSGTVASVNNNAIFTVQTGGVAGAVANNLGGNATNAGTVASLVNAGSFTNSANITGSVSTSGTLASTGTIDGALAVNGGVATISGTVLGTTTLSGGVLQGTGTLGALEINAGGTISPGNSPGTITVGTTTWNGGSAFDWQTDALTGTAGTNWDLITSAGALSLNATAGNQIKFTLSTLDATLKDVKKASWEVGNFAQGISGFERKAFDFDYTGMEGNDGRYFMTLGANNTALILNYKSAATWITGSGNWTTLSQWEDEQSPVDEKSPEDGDEVEFAGAGGTSTNNYASAELSKISGFSFLENAGAYTVNGNTLQIGEDGIINASSNLQTIGMDLTAGNELVVNAAAGDIAIAGIISGNSALTKTGSSTLTLSGNNTYSGLTTISAGTLALGGTAGAISSNSNITVDSGATFAVNRTNETTISNLISGAGSFAQVGPGVTRLRATNAYTGGTSISEGKLWVESEQALGTGNVLVNGGKLLVTSSQEPIMGNQSVSTFRTGSIEWNSGVVAFYDRDSSPEANSLTINVGGNFTVSTTGNATFDFSEVAALNSGNYTLVNATLVNADNNKFTAVHGPNTTLFGNFTTTANTVIYRVTGAVSGGTDIQNFGGPNTPVVANYIVTGPTVTIGANNRVNALTFSSSAPLTIQSGGELIVTSGTMAVQTGSSVVSGGTLNTPGNLNKTGAGELDLESNTNVNGIATVVEGLLSVNGQLAANEVLVDPLATLGGAGLIVAPSVIVNGFLSPGNSPGTLSIAGNLVLSDGSSTVIEIASPTSFDRIIVSGQATLAGTLNAVAYEGGKITPGTRYDFLQAGSITGEFDSIVVPDGLRGRFLNLGTVGSLLFGPESFVPYALNQNQRNVAKALDTFILATDGDALTVGTALDSLTAEQFPAAFDQIMPGFYESLANIVIEQTYNQTQLLSQRLGTVRLGAVGFQAIGLSQPIKYDKDGKSTADAKTASPIVESAIDTNWNAWVMANGEFSISRGLTGVPNYNNNAGGFLVGADYRLSENFVAGLFAGYEYSYAKYNGGSSTQGNSALFGLYGSYTHEDGYYADAIVSGGYTGFQTRRSIEFGTIDRTARANPNSGQFSAALNLGKDFEIGKFTLGPIIGAQYTYAGIGGFTETGADSLDLALGQQNANSLRTNLGARLAYNWEVATNITLIPEVRGFWMHEFLNEPRNINSALEGGRGPSFDYETSAPYSNSVFGGAGISAKVGDRWSASVFYNVNFGAEGYTNNIISTSLGFSF